MDALVQLLIQKFQQKVDVALVLYKSQSAGATEAPEVAKLKAAKIPLVIGTSSKKR